MLGAGCWTLRLGTNKPAVRLELGSVAKEEVEVESVESE